MSRNNNMLNTLLCDNRACAYSLYNMPYIRKSISDCGPNHLLREKYLGNQFFYCFLYFTAVQETSYEIKDSFKQ